MAVLVWIAKIVVVVALLGVAAAIATPKGRLPLALRGLKKMLVRDSGRSNAVEDREQSVVADGNRTAPSATKRLVAFVLVLLAILVAVL